MVANRASFCMWRLRRAILCVSLAAAFQGTDNAADSGGSSCSGLRAGLGESWGGIMRIRCPRLMSALAASAMVVGAMASPALTAPAQAASRGLPTRFRGLPEVKWRDDPVLRRDRVRCAGAGYNGQSRRSAATAGPPDTGLAGSPANGPRHNCTTYAAYRLQQNGYGYPGWTDNANGWARGEPEP